MTTPARRRPPGRYDEEKEPNQLLGLAVGLAFAVVVVLGALRLYGQYGDQDVQGSTRGYDVQSDGAVVVEFDVDRKDPTRAADCFVRARGANGAPVGVATVRIAPAAEGQDRVKVSHTVVTVARAVAGEVVTCRVAGER